MAESAISADSGPAGAARGEAGDDRRERRERRTHRVYGRLVRRFRVARMRRFHARFGVGPETRVLDVGGTLFNWELAPVRPRLTFVNLGARPHDLPAEIAYVQADATRLPFGDGAFDVVYSNSVIEHLGDLESQRAMAGEVRRVGRRYWVQTPDVAFPLEPHLLTPLIHWVPRRWRAPLLRNATVWGWLTRPSREESRAFVAEVRLLGKAELRSLFPDGEVVSERWLGLSKSLLAVRGNGRASHATGGAGG